MIGETVQIRRAAFTKDGYKFASESGIACKVEKVASDNAGGRNPYAMLRLLTGGGGAYYFRLNTGWGEKPVKSYQLCPGDLERLREFARGKMLKVDPKTTSPIPNRIRARRPKNAPKKQLTLWGDVSRD